VDLQPLQIDRSKERAPARRSRGLRFLWLFLMLGGFGGLLFLFRRPLLQAADRLRLPEVRVIQVSTTSSLAGGAVGGTSANGYVVARTRAALSADTPGRIVEMNVTEGQVVEKGFVVARLFAEEYRALYERAEADLSLARAGQQSALAAKEVSAGGLAQARSRVRAAEAEVADARSALEWAELEASRAERLLAQGVASQERVDQTRLERERAGARLQALQANTVVAQDGVRSAELELELAGARVREAEALVAVRSAERDQARATLDKTEVRAPFSGVVVLKDAEVGEVVSPNAVGSQSRGSVATMVDPATYEVQVEVPETNLTAVELQAPALIFLDAYPQDGYEGRVLRIWPTANRQKATVEVRVGFTQPDARLRPEMGARVVFRPETEKQAPKETASEPRILVPRSAVVTIDGRPHVFVLERDVARQREVVLGEEHSGRVVVERGLESGDRIVDAPPDSLREGERVREAG
jgi:RND family efflux transporter MFP subunit